MTSLAEWLDQHGLGKYAERFAEHDVGLDVLAELTDGDLERLGVSLGDRRRFLRAATKLDLADQTPEPGIDQSRQAERRQLTVMFADLVDSSHLATRLDPEDMQGVIAAYQRAVGDEVARFGGYVAKPLGDGLLIYFGWPQAHEDDAARALRSALAAIAAVGKVTTPDGQALSARIGIATGEVVVGDFAGAGVAEEGAVVGETPNLAARLQAVADPNAVVVAGRTRALAGRQFALTDLGAHTLKGFAEPVEVWRVDGETDAGSRFDALHGGHLGRFIGREHEVGLLMRRWEDVRDGECQLVLIAGEAGVGKSRLLSEVAGRIHDEAGRIAFQGSPLHTNTPLYPVVRHLQAKAGLRADDTPAAKWRKLAGAIASELPRKQIALAFLAELMSFAPPDDGSAPTRPNPDEQREAVFDVLADAARNETATAPLLIVVEDAHWLDATTQEFIERLLDGLQHRPALMLVTYRPEFVPPWAQHANVGQLSLSRLGKRDARAIVDAMVGAGGALSAEIAAEIVAKSDGVPLFVEELTSSALEATRAGGDAVQIPATLRDALAERLDRLGAAKEIAQVASAYGREFAIDLIAATLDRTETDLQPDVDRLTAIDVVFQTSRSAQRYAFRHALLQDAAYESMLKSKRREVHARIAEVLVRLRPDTAETEPEVLATHLSRAGDSAGAAACWRKAGHLALRNSAYREAIGAFTNALPLFPDEAASARSDTNRAIASAYFAVGDHKSVSERLEHAAADAEAAGDRVMMAEIAMQQSHDLIHYGGSVSAAFRFGQRALDIATGLDDAALAYGARFSLGQAAWISGNFADATGFLTANLPENLRDPERVRDFGTAGSLIMDSLSLLGATCAYLGEFDRAFGFLDRAVALATDGAFDVSVVQYHLSRAHLQRGDAATALPLARAAVRHATETGLTFTLPWLGGVLGYALTLTGNVEEAVSVLEKAVQESDAMHQPTANVRARVFLAEALAPDNPEHAREVAEAGLNAARVIGFRAQEAELLRIKALALAAADAAEAEVRANEGLALAQLLGMRPEEAHALRILADIQVKVGRADLAGESRDRARSTYRELGMAYWLDRMEPGGAVSRSSA